MTTFSKRHYQAIAQAVQNAKTRRQNIQNYNVRCTHYDELVAELADMFADDNPNFKKDLFVRACVPGANVKARS